MMFKNLKYDHRLRLLSFRSIENRRQIKLLNIAQCVRYKSENFPIKWQDILINCFDTQYTY